MKSPEVIPDADIQGPVGYLINGKIHVSFFIHQQILAKKEGIVIQYIDADEINYRTNLDEVNLFAGQQVNVFENGNFKGDATIIDYPYNHNLNEAEVCFHYPDKGKLAVIPVRHLIPVS
jgi:hypothetical protein